MNRSHKIIGCFVIALGALFGSLYFVFTQIDFIGRKDLKTVEANVHKWKHVLFSAEYRNGADHCKIELADSINIEISIGDARGADLLFEKYKLVGDTIVIQREATHVGDRLSTSKLLISDNKVYFKVDSFGCLVLKWVYRKVNHYGTNNTIAQRSYHC